MPHDVVAHRDIAAGLFADRLARDEREAELVILDGLDQRLDVDAVARLVAEELRSVGSVGGRPLFMLEVDVVDLEPRHPALGALHPLLQTTAASGQDGAARPPTVDDDGETIEGDGENVPAPASGPVGGKGQGKPPDLPTGPPAALCAVCDLRADAVDRPLVGSDAVCPKAALGCLERRLLARRSSLIEDVLVLASHHPSKLWGGWRIGILRRHRVDALADLTVADLEVALESAHHLVQVLEQRAGRP